MIQINNAIISIPHINSIEYDDSCLTIYIKMTGDKLTLRFEEKQEYTDTIKSLVSKLEDYYRSFL